MMQYLKCFGWLLALTVAMTGSAGKFWYDYLSSGAIESKKYGVLISGEPAVLILGAFSLATLVVVFQFLRSVVQYRHGS
jgi:hypothetical protein